MSDGRLVDGRSILVGVALGMPLDARTDLFSLGLGIYEARREAIEKYR